MNVLSDFMIRVEAQYPADIDNEELNALLLTIKNQEKEIQALNREVEMMRNNIVKDLTGDFKDEQKEAKKPVKKTATKAKATNKKEEPKPEKNASAKKATAKKTVKK